MKEALQQNQAEHFRQAVEPFRKALALKPDSVEAKAGLGIALVNGSTGKKGYREAVALLEDASHADGQNSRLWLALGMAYQFVGKKGDAMGAYRKYLELDPSGVSAKDVRALLHELGH
jgi:Flp pilus assembly protein TadD